jgi:Tfp pilus assembly protein PilV
MPNLCFLSQRPRLNQAGITPLGALIGMAIVMISLWGFLQANSSLRVQDARADRRVQGEQLLSSVALELHNMQMDDLTALCDHLNAFAAEATPGCGQSGDALSTTAKYSGNSTDPLIPARLRVRFDLKDTNIMAGTSCIDLQRCTWKAGKHILEVRLNGVWLVPPAKSISNKQLVFRKTR